MHRQEVMLLTVLVVLAVIVGAVVLPSEIRAAFRQRPNDRYGRKPG